MKIVLHKKKLTLFATQLFYFLIVVVAVFRATQFHVQLGDNMDLARHMYMMELVKQSGYSLTEYVFCYGDAFTSNISMRFCYGFNLLVYIISKCSDNYYLISYISVFFDYSMIVLIGADWWKKHNSRNGYIALFEVLICFSLLPHFQAVSGLRTATSACIMGLAIYLYLCKKRGFFSFVVVSVLAASFHPVFITAVPLDIIAKKVNRKKGLVVSIVASGSISLIANLFIRSPNQFLYSIAYKYLQYSGENGYKSTRFCYYGVLVICVLSLMCYFYFYIYKREGINGYQNGQNGEPPRTEVYDFIAFYMFFILSNIGKYEMVVRPGYLLGAMAPLVTSMVFNIQRERRTEDRISILIRIALFLIASYVSFMYLIWHSEYYA